MQIPKYEKGIRIDCSSVGSDESGTGELIGGPVFAAFKLTSQTLQKLKTFNWFNQITDAKEFSKSDPKIAQKIFSDIRSNFEEYKDYYVWNMRIDTYNRMFKTYEALAKKLNSPNIPKTVVNIIKSIGHNFVHKNLWEPTTFHIIDDFLEKEPANYYKYKSLIWSTEIIPIDCFCKKGGYKCLSVSISSILATVSYITNLSNLKKLLNIDFSPESNKHLPPTILEPIFKKISSEKGYSREYIYKNFCKVNKTKDYTKNLNLHQNNKIII